MKSKKRSDTLLASLQQLCCLGLASELVVPDLLKGLIKWISADNAQFMWVDKRLNPSNFYCNSDEATFLLTFSARLEHMTVPGQTSYKHFLSQGTVTTVGGSDDREYYQCTYYHEVMRACGGECTVAIPIRDANGVPRSSLGLNRSLRSQPFSDLERKRCAAFSPYLSLLFAPTPASTAIAAPQRIGEQGMAVYDAEGNLLHCDGVARQLIFLAGHLKLCRATDWRRNIELDSRIRRICTVLQSISQGTPAAAPPSFSIDTPWGRIVFSARLLSFSAANSPSQAIGMDVVRYIPRRIANWRQIATLDLSLRQRQVCLEFVENRSLSDIATMLGISRNTVIDYVNTIYERCGLEPGRENLQEYLQTIKDSL